MTNLFSLCIAISLLPAELMLSFARRDTGGKGAFFSVFYCSSFCIFCNSKCCSSRQPTAFGNKLPLLFLWFISQKILQHGTSIWVASPSILDDRYPASSSSTAPAQLHHSISLGHAKEVWISALGSRWEVSKEETLPWVLLSAVGGVAVLVSSGYYKRIS